MTGHMGGCHCGAVRFEVQLQSPITSFACNCSICQMLGYIHIIVPNSALRLLQGEQACTRYRFNSQTAEHAFCSTCGVKSFYRPRSNPDGWSVNARCLDDFNSLDLAIESFDGQNWEAHAKDLAHLSQGPS